MSSPHSPIATFAGKRVLVMGLGHFGGGLGAAKWLVSQGATVTVTDAAPADKLTDSLAALAGLPITFKLGGHDLDDLTRTDLLVVNPAVDRAKSEFVQAAIRAGVPTTTEMNLFLERCPALTVGITGSVGKSTTTALIYEALKAALHQSSDEPAQDGPRVFLGGNIGRSLLFDLPRIRPHDIVVLELSSFMLEETPVIQWSPRIAVVTNVFPNHLDRHTTMAGYSAAKQNILRFQKPGDVALLNNDHELVMRWPHLARGTVIKFTTRGPWTPDGKTHFDLSMPGPHNQSNAAAALAVLGALAGPPFAIALDLAAAHAAIAQYPGLPHRLQCVHTLAVPAADGTPVRQVRYFNDSKATSPDATVTAVEAFDPHTAIFIVGGYDKHLDRSAWAKFEHALAQRALAVLGIGATGPMLLDQLRQTAAAENITLRTHNACDLEKAVLLGHAWAKEMGAQALVLSPASASWGQFSNYEERGEQFAQLVQKLGPAQKTP